MRLDGKINKIERIVGTFRHGEVADEKRVFHLHVREAEARQENGAVRERLRVAMDEVMRLEARLGVDPPAPALLEDASEE